MDFCISSFRLRKNPTNLFPSVSGTIELKQERIQDLLDEEIEIFGDTYIIKSISYVGKGIVNFEAIHKNWALEKYTINKDLKFLSATQGELIINQIETKYKKNIIEKIKYGGKYGEEGWKVSEVITEFCKIKIGRAHV